jgi:hypothetical protein
MDMCIGDDQKRPTPRKIPEVSNTAVAGVRGYGIRVREKG